MRSGEADVHFDGDLVRISAEFKFNRLLVSYMTFSLNYNSSGTRIIAVLYLSGLTRETNSPAVMFLSHFDKLSCQYLQSAIVIQEVDKPGKLLHPE
jgi:hypothetical protein